MAVDILNKTKEEDRNGLRLNGAITSKDDMLKQRDIQHFDRFREPSKEDPPLSAPLLTSGDSIAESLYGYSFTPLSQANTTAKIRRQILSRGVDYMRHLQNRTRDVRRFSQPDIGILDSKTNKSTLQNTKAKKPENGEEEEFDPGRRQTIDVSQGLLPPIEERNISASKGLRPSSQYTRALHGPSRFLPQSQAILTTDANANILLFNDMASLCFGIDKSFIRKSILDVLEEPFRSQLKDLLQNDPKRSTRSDSNRVLVCGVIVPIRKMNQNNNSMSAASLWLKEKNTDSLSKMVYIWIFEEIYETSLSTRLDDKGNVVKVIGAVKEMFGYESAEIVGKPITQLIPTLTNTDPEEVEKVKFYGGKSNQDYEFPTMVTHSSPNTLKIISLPSIAGLVTVHYDGTIQSINPVPSKYLFGYSPESLVDRNISQLIPQFPRIVDGLRKADFLSHDETVNNHACRWVISDICTNESRKTESLTSVERHPSINPTSGRQQLPVIYAVHRDGSQFEIQVQLRLLEGGLMSVWVSYDRIYAHKRRSPQPMEHEEKKVVSLRMKEEPETKVLKQKHPLDDYEIVDTLGEGSYGTVKMAYRKDDPSKTKVAIKFIAKSKIVVDSWIRDRQLGTIPLEIQILKKLKESPHENCSALESYMEDEDTYFVVTKVYGEKSMDLFDYIELNDHIPEEEIRTIFRQVALAIEHLQSLHIVHRDIKDENILLDETGRVHLIDFGSAAYFREGRTFDTFSGTLDYCAPEILKGIAYEGPPQDIWSLGTLLYTLIYRENPFYNVDEILEHDLRIPFVMSEGSIDLIRGILNRDVKKRLTIQQILAHPWLNKRETPGELH